MINKSWVPVLGFVVALCGCGERKAEPPPGATNTSAGAQAIRTFQVRGVITSVKSGDSVVRIKHEEIPDYMPAMTMPFSVRDANELSGLKAGDSVQFRLNVTDDDVWIDEVRKTSAGSPPSAGAADPGPPGETGAFRRVHDVEPLDVGDALPDYRLTNQFGAGFSTGDFRGQALAITFIFTRCPLPTFCPRMGQNFARAQELLRGDASAPTNWHMLSISFDPEFDRPVVLKQYAEGQRYDPARWTFATGSLIDITGVAEQFGLAFWRDDSGSISHNLRTAVIDPAGRVHRVFDGNNWTGEELAAAVKTAAAKSGDQSGG